MNLRRRSGVYGSAVALSVLAAPVLGAVMYFRSDSEPDARRADVSTTDVETHGEIADWSRLTTSKLDGNSFAMSELSGKPAILYFWATWCPQCRVQREVLYTLSHEWGDRLRIVALAVDDDVPSVNRYLKTHASLARELIASPELLRLFGVEGLPTLVVIGAKGRIQSVSSGPTDGPELRRFVTPLLP